MEFSHWPRRAPVRCYIEMFQSVGSIWIHLLSFQWEQHVCLETKADPQDLWNNNIAVLCQALTRAGQGMWTGCSSGTLTVFPFLTHYTQRSWPWFSHLVDLQRYTGVPVHHDIFCHDKNILYIEQAIAIFTIHLHMHQQTWESTAIFRTNWWEKSTLSSI